MLRKSLVCLYVASLVVLGVGIGDRFAPRPARADGTVVCWPSDGLLYLYSIGGDPYYGFTIYSDVDCGGESGSECDSYISYVVWKWYPSPAPGYWRRIGNSAIYQSNACGTLGGTTQSYALGSGDWHVDAYMYMGTPLHSGGELADAHLDVTVP